MGCLASEKFEGIFEGIGQIPSNEIPSWGLSATAVSHVKGKEKSYKLADTAGLYLLVNPQGHRYWRFNYRFDGKFWIVTES